MQIQASGSQDRIDRIVLRLDLSVDVRAIDLYVLKGVEASAPIAPGLTRNNTIYEIALADILVSKNSTSISQPRITDTRLNTELCGIVTGLITQVDTTTLYSQVQADLASFQSVEQASFKAWLESIQDLLDEDVAGNLINLINTKIDQSSINQINGVAGIDANGKLSTVPSAAKISEELFIVSNSQPPVEQGKIWLKPIN